MGGEDKWANDTGDRYEGMRGRTLDGDERGELAGVHLSEVVLELARLQPDAGTQCDGDGDMAFEMYLIAWRTGGGGGDVPWTPNSPFFQFPLLGVDCLVSTFALGGGLRPPGGDAPGVTERESR